MSIRNFRFDAVTNRETWIDRVEVTDEHGIPFDLSSSSPRLELRYQPSGSTALFAVDGDGQLNTRDGGIIEWIFDAARMRQLRPGLYHVGLVATIEGVTRQILTGTIEIQDGYVR